MNEDEKKMERFKKESMELAIRIGIEKVVIFSAVGAQTNVGYRAVSGYELIGVGSYIEKIGHNILGCPTPVEEKTTPVN